MVIPQLILSGIIVRYDQLNPSVSSPTSIPWYGEIIAARWAYEGLAVHQYKNNAFEKDFYPYNKVMSEAIYHKDYWLKEIENKLNTIDRQLDNDETNSEKFAYNLRLVREELKKQIQENELFSFAQTDQITPDAINQQVIQNVHRLLEDMRKYYINLYNSASQQKDELLEAKRAKLMDNESFIRLKMNNANDQLSEFVRNSNSFDRIIEYNGRLYQKMDPIYKDPEPEFIRAHFYSPYKKFLGSFFPTYWVNFIVLWLMNILSFIILYKRWLVKLFAWIEKIVERVKS